MSSTFSFLTEKTQSMLDKYVPKDKQWLVLSTGAVIGAYYIIKGTTDAYTNYSKLQHYQSLGNQKRLELAAKQHPITDKYISTNTQTLSPSIRDTIINDLTAIDIRNAIIDGTYSCAQVCATFIMKCRETNKSINAVMETHYDTAMQLAYDLDSQLSQLKQNRFNNDLNGLREFISTNMPLFGVPMSVKDSIVMKDSDCTSGMLRLCMKKTVADGVIIQLMKKNGAIPFVKSSTPQLNMLTETNNHIIGHTRNPHDLTRTPGGSSGGEGALVGSKASILGIGTDVGGSLRNPAHFSGVIAHKPSSKRAIQRGRRSYVGECASTERIMASTGPVGRSMDDIVTFMKIWFNEGPTFADEYMLPVPFRNELYCYQVGQSIEQIKAQQKEILHSKGKLRIGYYYNDGWMSSSEPVRRAIDKVINVLTNDLGYECVKLTSMSSRGRDILRLYTHYMGAEGNLNNWVRALDGEPLIGGFKMLRNISFIPNWFRNIAVTPLLEMLGEYRLGHLSKLTKNGGLSVKELRDLANEMMRFRYEFYDEYKDCDLFLSPVHFCPAMPLNWCDKLLTSTTSTFLQNILDCAAGSFGPVTYVRESECHYDANVLDLPKTERDSWQRLFDRYMKGAKGLPVNVQLFGKAYDDELVLRVMKELEVYIQPTRMDKEKEMEE